MSVRLSLLVALVFSLAPIFSSAAIAADRFALVIGNAKYPDADAPLKEPVNDARSVADELKRDGFTVEVGENLTGDGMRKRVRAALRPYQAGQRRADLLQWLRCPIQPPKFHDTRRCPDMDRGGCPAGWHQSRDNSGRNQQPRRGRQDRADRCFPAQSVRTSVSQFLGRPCAGDCAERFAGDVFGSPQLGDFRTMAATTACSFRSCSRKSAFPT